MVRPRSRCPSCKAPVAGYDNIPVLSWLVLRGRCRSCRWPIPVRYPAVEIFSGLLTFLVYWRLRHLLPGDPAVFAWAALHGVVFVWLMVSVALIDLDHMIIPDVLSLPGAIFGVAIAFVASEGTGVSWRDAALGAVTGAGVILLVALIYQLVRKREGMGMGDMKFLATLGAFLGLKAVPFVIFAASLQGTLLALILWVAGAGRRPEAEPAAGEAPGGGLGSLSVPFGPFLALGAIEWYFLGNFLRVWGPFSF